MGYERIRLAEAVVEALTRTPTTTLKYISATLGVERHTLLRAVAFHYGCSFRCLKNECFRGAAIQLLSGSHYDSVKAIAYSMGYATPRSFSRRVQALLGTRPTSLRHSTPVGSAALNRSWPGSRGEHQ
jgi:AraC-like DNA-binding protein